MVIFFFFSNVTPTYFFREKSKAWSSLHFKHRLQLNSNVNWRLKCGYIVRCSWIWSLSKQIQ